MNGCEIHDMHRRKMRIQTNTKQNSQKNEGRNQIRPIMGRNRTTKTIRGDENVNWKLRRYYRKLAQRIYKTKLQPLGW